MPLAIRPATPADAPALSRICLLTADAGASAAPLHAHPALPGLVWALPYVSLPEHTWGFVLVDEDQDAHEPERTHAVLGYILGATDTRALEAQAEAEWWPALREKYPLAADTPPPAEDPRPPPLSPTYDPFGPGPSPSPARTPADARYVALLHRGWAPAPAACVRLGPAHMHINLLPAAQRRGWGRRLVAAAVRHLRADVGVDAVWLGMDPRNGAARAFYERLGFRAVEGAPGNYLGLRFDEWEG